MITRLGRTTIAGWLTCVLGTALFERMAPPPWVKSWQRLANPRFAPAAGSLPGWAVLETTGRNSGQLRRTPVGGRLRGNTFWLVAADATRSHYLRNIEANPTVRVRVHGAWRTGTARILTDDNPWRRLWRLNPLNSLFLVIADRRLMTLRIDLHLPSRREPGPPDWTRRLGAALSVLQIADAAGNLLVPRRLYTAHLDHLLVPRWLQPTLPAIKTAASAGLVLGLQSPQLQALTCASLTGYYGAAVAFHLAAEDRLGIAAPAAALAVTTAITAAGTAHRQNAKTNQQDPTERSTPD